MSPTEAASGERYFLGGSGWRGDSCGRDGSGVGRDDGCREGTSWRIGMDLTVKIQIPQPQPCQMQQRFSKAAGKESLISQRPRF
jgi:hypothetical protein